MSNSLGQHRKRRWGKNKSEEEAADSTDTTATTATNPSVTLTPAAGKERFAATTATNPSVTLTPAAGKERFAVIEDIDKAMQQSTHKKVCVVGAGVAALTAARNLQQQGFAVRVFGYCGKAEDGRTDRYGGRLYTENWDFRNHRMKGPYKVVNRPWSEETGVRFDTGSQFFTAVDPVFRKEVSRWMKAGVAKEWSTARIGCATLTDKGRCQFLATNAADDLSDDQMPGLICGNGGMTQIVNHLAEEVGQDRLCPHIAQRIVRGEKKRYAVEYEEVLNPGGYLDFVGGNLPQDTACKRWTEEFDYVLLAHGLALNTPRMVTFEDPKAQTIIEGIKRNVRFHNIQTLTLVFKSPLPLPADLFVIENGYEIAVVVHTSSKPGFSTRGGYDVWTAFSSPEFAANFALPKMKGESFRQMKQAFLSHFDHFLDGGIQSTGLLSNEGTPFGLLWPHGRCTTCPADSDVKAFFQAETGVAICGDYLGGAPGIQGAVVSAHHAVEAIVAHDRGGQVSKPSAILTDLDVPWTPMERPQPWIISHFPGLLDPRELVTSAKILPTGNINRQVAHYCCPTHDWLGTHPGIVFGRSAALGPKGRKSSGKGDNVRYNDNLGDDRSYQSARTTTPAKGKGKGKGKGYR